MNTPLGAPPEVTSTLQLRAIAEHDDDSERDVTLESAWSSDAPDVIEVDRTGLCRKNAVGTAVITAVYVDETGQRVTATWPVSS